MISLRESHLTTTHRQVDSMKDLPARKPNRLKGYDYSQNGCYFITICVKDRRELFWSPPVGARIARPPLSDIGEVVRKAIENIPHIYKPITIDKYVIMPNHIHLILLISDVPGRAMRAPTISTVINQICVNPPGVMPLVNIRPAWARQTAPGRSPPSSRVRAW